MTRESQKNRIKEINQKLKEMSELVINQLNDSMLALETFNTELANKIPKEDDYVDNLQKEIEEECIKFIATEQPVAKDLRNVYTASKIVTDLERMADHTVDISKIVKYMDKYKKTYDYKELEIMKDKIIIMIKSAMKAYELMDSDKAYEICKLDDEIDNLHKEVFTKLLIILKNDNKIEEGTRLLFVSKHLERIGDYVTNICEWIIFAKKGKYVDLNE